MKQPQRWYEGISRYQWMVLTIASLGWIFDVFEGQIFVASMNEAMPDLLPSDTPPGRVSLYNNISLGLFLLGGAVGGVFFGALSDRIGRTKTMVITILIYSLFTCVTAFAQNWQQMAVLRFLVALGVGGEWAVATAMVAEVFPDRARAWSGAIFHGSSVFGTYLAVLAGAFVVGNPDIGWRWGFAIGAIPALLTLWIRWKLREPDKWVRAREDLKSAADRPRWLIAELFKRQWITGTWVGVGLATVGLATFWGVHIYGKDLLRADVERTYATELPPSLVENDRPIDAVLSADLEKIEPRILTVDADKATPQQKDEAWIKLASLLGSEGVTNGDDAREESKAYFQSRFQRIKRWEMLGMLLVTTGGGLGLVFFGPLSEGVGRKPAFAFYHLGGLVSALLLFQVIAGAGATVLMMALPVFGFLTLGMHAGYAVYFPELFPTHLRGTGAGFCFNAGRIIAAPILFVRGWLRDESGLGLSLVDAASVLSLLFLVGLVLVFFARETKGQPLPD